MNRPRSDTLLAPTLWDGVADLGPDEELRRLRACVRDLVALSTVPAMWEGRELGAIADGLLQLLLSVGRLDYAYVRLWADDAAPLELLQARGEVATLARDELIRQVARCVATGAERFEIGFDGVPPLRSVAFPIGIEARLGIAVAGSASADFPTGIDTLLLRVAANQCAISLRHQRLLADAQRAEESARLSTERAEHARHEAELANRAKSDFLASMSHELRTPLNAIAGYTTLIDMGLRGPVTEEQRADLARIRRSQEYLLGLINDVLNFAKLEAGHVTFVTADVDVWDAIVALDDLVQPQLAARQLLYRREEPGHPLVVRADREKLVQIMLNLVGNATKFTPPGGEVAIRCDGDTERVRVHVRDSGIGIPAERLESIFEPFVQVPRDLRSTREGVGLGLAISRDLARAMGGDLAATSAPGAGSIFTLTLPRAAR